MKLRPPLGLSPSHLEFFFASAYCLDIKWSQEGSVKTFQALELKAENVTVEFNEQRFHPARYLHAEYDMTANAFRHFDGAVQLYTEEEYLTRRDSDFNHNLKNADQIKARSKKMFKLNGKLQVSDWVELCCHFLTANPLGHEYFSGSYPSHIRDVLEKLADSSGA